MLDKLEIKNFRGIKNLSFNSSKNINIFTGMANTGKTSVLEAIYMILKLSPEPIIKISELRAIIGYNDIFTSLFYDYNLENSIKLEAVIGNEKINMDINPNTKIKRISYPSDNQILINDSDSLDGLTVNVNLKNSNNYKFSINVNKINNSINFQFSGNNVQIGNNVEFIAEYHSKSSLQENLKNILVKKKEKDEFQKYCKQFDDNIMYVGMVDNKIAVETNNLENALNIKSMGKGFQTYITIIASMVAGKRYILIDEIENGIHYKTMEVLIKNIMDLSKEYKLQFFITTHSKEFLQTLNKIAEDNNYSDMIFLYNLYLNKENNIDYSKFTQENFNHFMETDSEVRD